jgi:UDP-GlcNAc:undecaprenyl-phosphate GlcNAc-1-phosphate transferase
MSLAAPRGLLAAAVAWHVATFRLAPRLGLVKLNFRKAPIMASYGVASFGYVVATLGSLGLMDVVQWRHVLLYLWVMAAMWALGVADDIWGSRDVGGFAGHFRKLFKECKLTTGAAKAIGGGAVGIWAGYQISDGDPARWILAAMLVPLSANLLNLFDLRPGRAVAVFFLALGVICIVALGSLQSAWIVGAIAAVALVWAIPDSLGRAMMGDSGSNSLGAALGITMALNTGIVFQLAAICVIAALHVFSERHSITDLIEHNRTLSWIDRRLGVR